MTRTLLTLSVAVLTSTGFAQAAPIDPVAQLQWIDHADAKADFHRNVEEKHDMRFIAVNGLSSNMVIGVGDATLPIVQKHGFWTIQGTGDAMISKEHARLVLKAVTYAGQYNKMSLNYFHSHKDI